MHMNFFANFTETDRAVFESVSSTYELSTKSYLMRRGEPGGDIFFVEQGGLEVVDRRRSPEVILASLPSGTLVGEMSFLEDSPRSADVRATEPSLIRKWARNDLRTLLEREPTIAARFYEAAARTASRRMRDVTSSALSGSMSRTESSRKMGMEALHEEVMTLAEGVKEALLHAENLLRSTGPNAEAHQLVQTTLDSLESQVYRLYKTHTDSDAANEATRLLGRELHPYLVRSALGRRALGRHQQETTEAEFIAHILVNSASGEGHLGESIDRWLLDRPTLKAVRAVRDAVVKPVADAIPKDRERHLLVLNAGTGSMVASLGTRLGAADTVLTVVDPSRDALAFLDAGVALRPKKVQLRTAQHNLVQFALGRVQTNVTPQDAIIVHGLIEYMPDRIVVSLLRQVAGLLGPGGIVLATALAASPDGTLLDRLLGWPTVRRGPERLIRLFERAGLHASIVPTNEPALLVAEATKTP